jgi:hypothetical protein
MSSFDHLLRAIDRFLDLGGLRRYDRAGAKPQSDYWLTTW